MKKQSITNILSRLSKLMLMLALVAYMSSCDSVIYDYEEDCEPDVEQPDEPKPDKPGKPDKPDTPDEPAEPEPDPTVYYVEYIFERNMQFTDGFNNRVNSVDLYVFNTSGTFVKKYHEEGAPLTQKGYLMELTDLPAGTYDLVAWCGGEGYTSFFTIPSSVSRPYELTATLNANSGNPDWSNSYLTALFHGMSGNSPAVYTDEPGDQIYTIYLTKDTNDITLTLQHKDLLPFAKNRFSVSMTDKNGFMLYDNSVPDSNETIEYLPNKTTYGEITGKVDGVETVGNFLKVDLSTARLMKEHLDTAVITVVDTENYDKVIWSIPVIKWALNLRAAQYKGMEDQEYLDREDQYNLMLWLDSYDPETGEDQGWFGASIEINDWHVIDDEMDLK